MCRPNIRLDQVVSDLKLICGCGISGSTRGLLTLAMTWDHIKPAAAATVVRCKVGSSKRSADDHDVGPMCGQMLENE